MILYSCKVADIFEKGNNRRRDNKKFLKFSQIQSNYFYHLSSALIHSIDRYHWLHYYNYFHHCCPPNWTDPDHIFVTIPHRHRWSCFAVSLTAFDAVVYSTDTLDLLVRVVEFDLAIATMMLLERFLVGVLVWHFYLADRSPPIRNLCSFRDWWDLVSARLIYFAVEKSFNLILFTEL